MTMKLTAKTNYLIVTLLASGLLGCKNSNVKPEVSLNGRYSGQFYANEAIDAFKTGPITNTVTASISGSNYTDTAGNVIHPNYPGGIDKGTFKLQGDQVTFVTTLAHPDNFDTNLTLNGSYSYVIKSDSLILIKTLGSNIYTYKLKKQ